ncbi:MAG: hypothetical protein K2N56_05695 [Oscillospiraceae bacterium]|nr:hypothetical protein [Oscillospiraceae bacterium]
MKKKILSAVPAFVLCAALFTGCSDSKEPNPSMNNGINSGGNSNTALNPFEEQALIANVNSANFTASSFRTSLNSWIADIHMRGGELPKESATIEISVVGGKVTATAPGFKLSKDDSSSYAAEQYLVGLISGDYILDEDMYVLAFFDSQKGQIVGTVFSKEADLAYLKRNFSAADFSAGIYNWGGSMDGLVDGNRAVGTNPTLKKN